MQVFVLPKLSVCSLTEANEKTRSIDLVFLFTYGKNFRNSHFFSKFAANLESYEI